MGNDQTFKLVKEFKYCNPNSKKSSNDGWEVSRLIEQWSEDWPKQYHEGIFSETVIIVFSLGWRSLVINIKICAEENVWVVLYEKVY